MYPLKFMYVCMYVCILTRLAYRYIFMLTEYRRSHQCDQDLVVYVCMYVCFMDALYRYYNIGGRCCQ
jgi:hypothetical protein